MEQKAPVYRLSKLNVILMLIIISQFGIIIFLFFSTRPSALSTYLYSQSIKNGHVVQVKNVNPTSIPDIVGTIISISNNTLTIDTKTGPVKILVSSNVKVDNRPDTPFDKPHQVPYIANLFHANDTVEVIFPPTIKSISMSQPLLIYKLRADQYQRLRQ